MSLDVHLTAVRPHEVFSANITHNLSRMAKEAGVHDAMWRPELVPLPWYRRKLIAKDLIKPLSAGLVRLESDPEYFKRFNPDNQWGNYDNLLTFVKLYLEACRTYPDASVRVWR